MTQAAKALIAEFENAAKAAQEAEVSLRRKAAEEVARIERQRAFAFRRARLVRTLLASAATAEAADAAIGMQERAICDELGWVGASAAHREILDRLRPVGRAVWQCGCGADGGTPADVTAQLEEFEAWFEATRGNSFYSLFDQYVAEVPVVDF